MPDSFGRLQFRHFKLIQAIAESGQISIAAERLAMTQPAASRTVAEIERLLGERLFVRHPKGVKLTPMGELLARHATVLLSDFDRATSDLHAFKSGRLGTVHIGAVTGAAVGFVVPAIQSLEQDLLSANVRVEVAPSVDLMDGLLSGDLDFVLCRIPPNTDTSRLEVLLGRVERLRLLAQHSHPLAGKRAVTLNDMCDCTWVMQAPSMPIREAVDACHIELGISPPQNVIESSSLLVTLAYLQATHAVSPVAFEVAELMGNIASQGLAVLDLDEPVTLSPYHLIRQRGRPLGPLAQQMLLMVHRQMASGGTP